MAINSTSMVTGISHSSIAIVIVLLVAVIIYVAKDVILELLGLSKHKQ